MVSGNSKLTPKRVMNMENGLTIHSLAPGLREVERCLDWVLNQQGVTNHVTPIVQSGGNRNKKCNGYTAARYRGKAADAPLQPYWSTKEGESSIELSLVGQNLDRPTIDIIGTVIHEAVHITAIARGIKDCALSGRHNKRFKELAESFGLVVVGLDDTGKPINKWVGYGLTELGDALKDRVINEFVPNDSAFAVFRINRNKSRQPPKFECPTCKEFVRGHGETQTRVETYVFCGHCMVPMVKVG